MSGKKKIKNKVHIYTQKSNTRLERGPSEPISIFPFSPFSHRSRPFSSESFLPDSVRAAPAARETPRSIDYKPRTPLAGATGSAATTARRHSPARFDCPPPLFSFQHLRQVPTLPDSRQECCAVEALAPLAVVDVALCHRLLWVRSRRHGRSPRGSGPQ